MSGTLTKIILGILTIALLTTGMGIFLNGFTCDAPPCVMGYETTVIDNATDFSQNASQWQSQYSGLSDDVKDRIENPNTQASEVQESGSDITSLVGGGLNSVLSIWGGIDTVVSMFMDFGNAPELRFLGIGWFILGLVGIVGTAITFAILAAVIKWEP